MVIKKKGKKNEVLQGEKGLKRVMSIYPAEFILMRKYL